MGYLTAEDLLWIEYQLALAHEGHEDETGVDMCWVTTEKIR